MDKINDGGSAFPGTWHPEMGWSPHQTPYGMSLRDWFAGQALAGLATTASHEDMENLTEGTIGGRFVVGAAYALADAMLKAREAK